MTTEADIAAIAERLVEWGRWVRPKVLKGHCASIEHRYIYDPEDFGDEVQPKEKQDAKRAEPDVHKCAEIERVIGAPTFPKAERRILVQTYVWNRDPRVTCRQCAIARRNFETVLRQCHVIVHNRLSWLALRTRRMENATHKPTTA